MDINIKNGFADVWKFYAANYDMQNSNSEWDRLLNESHKLYSKYECVPIVTEFLFLTIKDIERHIEERSNSQ